MKTPSKTTLAQDASLYALGSALFWWDALAGLRAPFHPDLLARSAPAAEFLRKAFVNAELPLWDPRRCSGLPASPSWLYPSSALHLLVYDYPRALSLDLFLHTALAGFAMRLLAGRLGLGRGAALLAGGLYGLSAAALYASPGALHAAAWGPLALLAPLALMRRPRPASGAPAPLGWGLGLLACAALGVFLRARTATVDPAVYRRLSPTAAFLHAEEPNGGRAYMTARTRAEAEPPFGGNLDDWMAYKDLLHPGVPDAGGTDCGPAYQAALDELEQDPLSPWMDRLAVRHVLTRRTLPAPRFRLVRESRGLKVYENPAAKPRAYFLARSSGVIEGAEDLEVEASTRPPEVAFSIDRPSRVELDVSAPSRGWLVLADRYDPGWKASVNNVPTRILRAYGVQRAVPVGPGESRVVFVYGLSLLQAR